MVDTSTLIKGIDVSVIQGNIDWASVAAAGYQFAICRCGVGNEKGKDSKYDQNVAAATAAGLKVAAYHFVYPLPPLASQPARSPQAQAQMHVAAAGSVPVVCCDLEWPVPQDWAKWGCSAAQIVQWTLDYLQEYERLSGIRPIVYTYPSFASSIQLPASFADTYKLWIASYTASPAIPHPWTDWVMWQNSGGTQKLPNGVPVDTDYAKDLSLWDAAPVAPTPDPTPAPAPAPVDPTPAPAPVPAPVPAPSSWANIWNVVSSVVGNLIKK
jgi:lysozyme